MAKNDVVLLDAILEQRESAKLPSDDRAEVFEYFAFEQLLKNYDLSAEELAAGWTDGRDDGGIDGFFVFINGNLLTDANEFAWPRSSASIEVWLLTCKHHPTFEQKTVDTLLATIPELFDFSLESGALAGRYCDEVLHHRELFHLAYRKLSITRAAITINVVYASRGDTSSIGDSVARRAENVVTTFTELFSSSSVHFRFVGATELVDAHRRVKRFSLDLPFVEHLATGRDSYVLLVRLEDYCGFVTDENGNLRRYLFDSNVRDYLGANQVNQDIAASLADASAPDFWWLNNGVTILATNATVPGKTIQLQDIQIVNGLQTTETIFGHFHGGPATSGDRTVLVKIIVSTDPFVRDRIIRATNNQSPVEIAALHATDKIQRDIEAMLERHDWFYERRKNYFRNIGKPEARIITPLYVASAVVALVLKDTPRSSNLRARFMRHPASYEKVFAEAFPPELWPALVEIFKQVERGLANKGGAKGMAGERFIHTWRGLLAFMSVARLTGTFLYDIGALLRVSPHDISQSLIDELWQVVMDCRPEKTRIKRPHPTFVRACYAECATRFRVEGVQYLRPIELERDFKRRRPPPDVTEDFVRRVDEALPQQPWKVGVHREIALRFGVTPEHVSIAIQKLIADGKRNEQKDGVVYGPDGEIIAFDKDRVTQPPEITQDAGEPDRLRDASSD